MKLSEEFKDFIEDTRKYFYRPAQNVWLAETWALEDKLKKIESTLENWVKLQGHNRCHFYPEILEKIATLLGLETKVSPGLPPLAEFKKGCERYQEEQYNSPKDYVMPDCLPEKTEFTGSPNYWNNESL